MPRTSFSRVAPLLACLALGCNGDEPKPPDTGTDTDTVTDTGTPPDPNDVDGDGSPASEDCDDNNPLRFPGAVEHCDGIDNNCVDDVETNIITVLPAQSFATLAEAAAAVGGGETVQICPGTYVGTAAFTVPITLLGISDGTRPVLDGGGGLTTLRLDGAGSRVEGLAITGGTGSGVLVGLGADATLVDLDVYDNIGEFGAGIQFSPEGGSLTDSIVRENVAEEDGGGVYTSGSVVLERVEVHDNVAGNWGGGIAMGDSADLVLTDVSIYDNAAERGGGMLARPNTEVTATGTTRIEGNTASSSGGGVYLFATDWSGGEVVGNSAIDTGGGLYVFDGGSIVGMLLEGNDASRGGGLFAAGTVALEGLDVTSNVAELDGGGAYLLDADASLTGTTIRSNEAPDGGGMYLQDSSILDGLVTENVAEDGGGIFVSNVEKSTVARIEGTRVEDNEADVSGGGIYLPDNAELIDVVVVRNLSTDRAGGIYVTNEAEVSVQGAVIQSNTAVQRGGGLYANTSSVVDVRDSDVSRNQALRGGGVYINNDSTVEVRDSVVAENGDTTTVSGGGARIITGDLVSITSDWGDGPLDNAPNDVYSEQGALDGYAGYGANATFACDALGCTPEP